MLPLLIFFAKLISSISRILNLGNGGTWPGEIILKFKPHILNLFSAQLKKGSILIAGTNGKTTTSLMIKKILESEGNKVIHNDSGANLVNGIVSAFIQQASWTGKVDADWGVFEVDENSLPLVISNFKNSRLSGIHDAVMRTNLQTASGQISKTQIKEKELILVFLNLFRDQLDRYGEVDVIAEKWIKVLKNLPRETKIILNSDDPLIAHLGKSVSSTPGVEARYFGLDDPNLFLKEKEHATDSTFCLNCGNRLEYEGVYYSHIGIWKCPKCGDRRPKPDINEWKSPLVGVYNKYNTLAAVSAAKLLGITDKEIVQALADFSPAFGRQEEFIISGKKIKIFLSKNPAGFNESLRTVLNLGAKEILFVLNDRIPDGRDVSWIWDVDFEMLANDVDIIVSGDRAYDMALRIKYSQIMINQKSKIKNQKYKAKVKSLENLEEAVNAGLVQVGRGETFYILATYSAMLEVRKVLGGRKIL